jgi:large conductance mechanosensitive channel
VITPLLLTPALKFAHLNDIDGLKWGAVKYGVFLSNVIKFLVIAFILFLIIKAIHKIDKKKAAAPPDPTLSERLLMEIRDELKNRR